MAQELYEVSVPGSMMLMGEHAVLYGYQSIVCAIKNRIKIKLVPNTSDELTIIDTRLGKVTQNVNNISVTHPFSYVLSVIKYFSPNLSGFTLSIESEFSSTIGLGSSAAVTIGAIAIIGNWVNKSPLPNTEIFRIAKLILKEVQGCGSGADLCASLYGGVINYSLDEFSQLPLIPDLTVIYCGYKKPTKEVIEIVRNGMQLEPARFSDIFLKIHEYVIAGTTAIMHNNWQSLGILFTKHQKMQEDLGTSDQKLQEIIKRLSSSIGIFGAKISGSGLGDCVIGLGMTNVTHFAEENMMQFIASIDRQGLVYANN